MGGVTAMYEFANGLARRGHEVHIAHGAFWGRPGIRSLDELAWFQFDPSVVHHFGEGSIALPDADVIFGTGAAPNLGLPVLLVQGFEMFPEEIERKVFRTPCLKVCVASWLEEVGVGYGVPPEQMVHVPMGIDHDTFRVIRAVEDRPRRVAILRNTHPAKGWAVGLAALEIVHRERPDVEVVAFGIEPPDDQLPEWIEPVTDPSTDRLVEDIYNGAQVFLQSSMYEGFGFTAVEAMACGCALVTTDNGGSRDYALHGQTALVAPAGDEVGLAAHTLHLLDDLSERIRIAEAGRQHVQRFRWDDAAATLEGHLLRYLAEPVAFQGRVEPWAR
jgi:glycosyltransferase involved in cell wall biosynthesis